MGKEAWLAMKIGVVSDEKKTKKRRGQNLCISNAV